MVRYADPTRCPDCLATLPQPPQTCPGCGLRLTGDVAVDLFATLQSADRLLERLREVEAPPLVPVYDVPSEEPRRSGLSALSVPRILLGLGVLCLLVAAITFLAVAWAWLGVGGRTGVLLVLTGASGVVSARLHRRRLRLAAESLAVVAFGLLVLDLVGADDAGWLGSLTGPELVALVGAVVGGAGLVTALALREGPEPMVAPQIFAVLGLWAVPAGIAVETDGATGVLAVAAAGLLALAACARALSMPLLTVLLGLAGSSWWLMLVVVGVERALAHPSVAELAGRAEAWPLVAAVAILVAGALAIRHRPPVAAAVLGAAGVLGSFVLLVPALDNAGADASLVLLALLLLWATGGPAVRGPWRRALEAPLLAAGIGTLVIAAVLVADALRALGVASEDPWSRSWSALAPAVRSLDPGGTPAPMLLPLAAGLLLALATWRRTADQAVLAVREYAAQIVAALLLVGGVVALSSQQPLALVVTLVVAASATLGVGSWPRADHTGAAGLVGATALGLLALVVALPSVVLTSFVLALAVAASGWLLLPVGPAGSRREVRSVAGAVLPAALAGLGWSLAEIGAVPDVWRAAPVLLVLGLLALVRPHLPLEASAAIVGVVVVEVSVSAAEATATALALHLTLAGALVTTSALVHDHRRVLGWVGSGLLAAATWVRLWDVGVEAPEAYTLPSAVALVLVGLRHLAVHPEAGTGRVLAPGLVLATVPSLLRVLVEDPVSPRAALLGLGCLGLVLVGARLRWQAPLVVGAAVGAVLVLREWGPYAGVLPPWVWIALAGTALLVVGVTWERRLQDLQGGAAYLARLR